MATKLRLYSTDCVATLTPDTLEGAAAPSLLIAFDHDPLKNGIQIEPPAGRGGIILTGGGVVYHDLGVVEGDGILTVSGNVDDGEHLLPATINALKAAELVIDAEYFLTDGMSCWKVRWSRNPRGLKCWYHALWAYHGRKEYSYELTFIIVQTVIS